MADKISIYANRKFLKEMEGWTGPGNLFSSRSQAVTRLSRVASKMLRENDFNAMEALIKLSDDDD